MNGKVFLVGAGPGDPELLTLRAHRLLQTADVVLHDDLVSREILELIPSTTQVRNVGKRCGHKSISQQEINSLLVAYASFGLTVVRLKTGDPLIFGRAGEEMEALRKAEIDLEVVPGITAAFGAASAAEVSLTRRDVASSVLFVSRHTANSPLKSDLGRYASARTTLVIYMPGYDYDQIARQLVSGGLEDRTPCAIVSRANSPDQRIHRTTIGKLSSSPRLPAPTLLIVGEVVDGDDTAARQPEGRVEDPAVETGQPLPASLDLFADNQVFWGD
jgi:uroporphyrin-III C-methyltransferase